MHVLEVKSAYRHRRVTSEMRLVICTENHHPRLLLTELLVLSQRVRANLEFLDRVSAESQSQKSRSSENWMPLFIAAGAGAMPHTRAAPSHLPTDLERPESGQGKTFPGPLYIHIRRHFHQPNGESPSPLGLILL